MNPQAQKDLSRSSKDFVKVVWPEVSGVCGGGRLIPVETVTDSRFTKQLDMLSGIDAWQVLQSRGIRGIASRVQRQYLRDTFTMRCWRESGVKTEYDKRMDAYHATGEGWLLPHLTIQAYVHREEDLLLRCGIIRTVDLLDYCEAERDRIRVQNTFDGGASFLILPFADIAASGRWIHIVDRCPGMNERNFYS